MALRFESVELGEVLELHPKYALGEHEVRYLNVFFADDDDANDLADDADLGANDQQLVAVAPGLEAPDVDAGDE